MSTIMSYRASDAGSMSPGAMLIILVIAVVILVANWKILTKAGEPGWACIVPFYGNYVLFRMVYGNGLKFLLMFVPILNYVAAIMVNVRLCQRFGKGVGFILGMIFLSPIFMCILAFDDSYYLGPDTQSFL